MAVLEGNMTSHAEIIVITNSACNKVFLGKFLNAAIASASRIIIYLLLLFCLDQGSLGVIISGNALWSKCLCSAAGNLSIFDAALDHPMGTIGASHTSTSAIRAEIKVTILTYTTVVVVV
jgi:hypothetical protein